MKGRNLSVLPPLLVTILLLGSCCCQEVSAFFQQLLPTTMATKKSTVQPVFNEETGTYDFVGRVWFRPALKRIKDIDNPPPGGVSMVNLFGWTVGGVVALEYDESPVGPYREYVTMGAVVTKRGAIGQWGTRLYVNDRPAELICSEIWGVPAEYAEIEFDGATADDDDYGSASSSRVASAPDSKDSSTSRIKVSGWQNTRNGLVSEGLPLSVPILWTPTIKALWAPIVPLPEVDETLPLYPLKLTFNGVRIHSCGQEPSALLGIPLPIGLSMNAKIQISAQDGVL